MVSQFDYENQQMMKSIAQSLKIIAEELHLIRLIKENELGLSNKNPTKHDLDPPPPPPEQR